MKKYSKSHNSFRHPRRTFKPENEALVVTEHVATQSSHRNVLCLPSLLPAVCIFHLVPANNDNINIFIVCLPFLLPPRTDSSDLLINRTVWDTDGNSLVLGHVVLVVEIERSVLKLSRPDVGKTYIKSRGGEDTSARGSNSSDSEFHLEFGIEIENRQGIDFGKEAKRDSSG